MPLASHADDMVTQVGQALLDCGRGRAGDVVVIVAGTLPGRTGSTDMIRVHELR